MRLPKFQQPLLKFLSKPEAAELGGVQFVFKLPRCAARNPARPKA